ncbi:hypothetical protein HMPREF9431_00364 [Segatella oulorum F0390]|uniref:Uncharacterized protein n=1 Tax=Segatella oulorum F0390 TaxID=702438 RepID=G1W963_9BACT|nr:hypothetical protein HMPREF9431_00364 [Segatella oulorum F0390]
MKTKIIRNFLRCIFYNYNFLFIFGKHKYKSYKDYG